MKRFQIARILVIAALAACFGQVPSDGAVRDGHLALRLVPGPAYKFATRWLIFSMPIYPQVACWIETPSGDYVDTIYVTAKGAKNKWMSAPSAGRPEALPVWSHLRKEKSAVADGVSGATPSGATKRDATLPKSLPKGRYIFKLEVNRSYDYNESFTRVTGQPSLIYECAIDLGDGPSKASFVPIGQGSVDGSDGTIRPGLKGITTALDLLADAEISYEGEAIK